MGGNEEGAKLFLMVPADLSRGNGHKFCVDTQNATGHGPRQSALADPT